MWTTKKHLDFRTEKLPGNFPDRYIWPRAENINDEIQHYVANQQLTAYEGDGMVLQAIRNDGSVDTAQPWLSSMFTTHGTDYILSANHTERVTARLRFPSRSGAWCGFWGLPEHSGGWHPNYYGRGMPENDFVEHMSNMTGQYYSTYHTYDDLGVMQEDQRLHTCPIDFTEYNDFGYERNVVTGMSHYLLNGDIQKSFVTPSDLKMDTHIIINLAVGGAWPRSLGNTVSESTSYFGLGVQSLTFERFVNPNQDLIDELRKMQGVVTDCVGQVFDDRVLELG